MTAVPIPRDLREPDVSPKRAFPLSDAAKAYRDGGVAALVIMSLSYLAWYFLAYAAVPWVNSQILNDAAAREDAKVLTKSVAEGITSSISLLAANVSRDREAEAEFRAQQSELLRDLVKDVKEIKAR